MTRRSGARDRAVSGFAPYAVYTILHPSVLKGIGGRKKAAPLSETKRWATAALLFNEFLTALPVT
jgi:hypothetical protein